jgi:hypothetical protein
VTPLDPSSPERLIVGVVLLLCAGIATSLWNVIRSSKVRTVQTRILATQAAMQATLDAAHAENTAMLKRLEEEQEAMRRRLHDIASVVNATTTRVAIVETRTDNIDRAFARLERALEIIAGKLDRVLEGRGA